MNNITRLASGLLLCLAPTIAANKLNLADLPAPVQATVKEQTKSATLVGLSKEIEKGKTLYEVERKINGKTRDLLIDPTGAIVESEDEVALDTLPPAAKAALQQKAAGGTIRKVEKLTQDSSIAYEATIKTKTGKSLEAAVNEDGTPHRK